jgi:hypothetical protein
MMKGLKVPNIWVSSQGGNMAKKDKISPQDVLNDIGLVATIIQGISLLWDTIKGWFTKKPPVPPAPPAAPAT